MTRLRRSFFSLIFSLLLLAMQYGAQLHALEHVGESLRQRPDHSLSTPRDEVCPLCVLFASGANALSGDPAAAPVFQGAASITLPPPLSVVAAAPSYYSSRAPPFFL
jgi:hypothetical protein